MFPAPGLKAASVLLRGTRRAAPGSQRRSLGAGRSESRAPLRARGQSRATRGRADGGILPGGPHFSASSSVPSALCGTATAAPQNVYWEGSATVAPFTLSETRSSSEAFCRGFRSAYSFYHNDGFVWFSNKLLPSLPRTKEGNNDFRADLTPPRKHRGIVRTGGGK